MSHDLADRVVRDAPYMEKLNNFSNCLNILKKADYDLVDNNDIYRTGVICQFDLTFRMAWKALQAVLIIHSVADARTGTLREILQLGYKFGFIDDSAVWLAMLNKRNTSVHIYDENEIDEMVLMIRDSFTTAFTALENILKKKIAEANGEW